MEFQHASGRLWLEDTEGRLLAEVLFPDAGRGMLEITHTFVDDSLRGQGVAGKLMEAVAEELRSEHKKAKLTCTYAAAWFRRYSEYADLVV